MFNLPQLEYDYDALEPYIDAKTMEIHHSKHHQAYVNNLNAAMESIKELDIEFYKKISKITKKMNQLPQNIQSHTLKMFQKKFAQLYEITPGAI